MRTSPGTPTDRPRRRPRRTGSGGLADRGTGPTRPPPARFPVRRRRGAHAGPHPNTAGSPATDARRLRLHHVEHHLGRNCGIESVASPSQDVECGLEARDRPSPPYGATRAPRSWRTVRTAVRAADARLCPPEPDRRPPSRLGLAPSGGAGRTVRVTPVSLSQPRRRRNAAG